MINIQLRILNFGTIIPLLSLLLIAVGCQKVDKPVRGKAGSGPMTIVIEAEEAPKSHYSNTTSEGEKLVNPYNRIPAIGMIFMSRLKGLEFWKANHPNLVTGTYNPLLKADPEERCLDCHDQNTSCNNCHNYVGVKLITAENKKDSGH